MNANIWIIIQLHVINIDIGLLSDACSVSSRDW